MRPSIIGSTIGSRNRSSVSVSKRRRERKEKRHLRTLYHMRHAKDYETLRLQPGASKVEVKKSYRRLAMIGIQTSIRIRIKRKQRRSSRRFKRRTTR